MRRRLLTAAAALLLLAAAGCSTGSSSTPNEVDNADECRSAVAAAAEQTATAELALGDGDFYVGREAVADASRALSNAEDACSQPDYS